jgi:hypothetical protein
VKVSSWLTRWRSLWSGRLRPEEVLVGCVAENTPAFLTRAVRLVRSVRWFGGSFAEARVLVCVVEGIEPGARRELEELGAEVRIVSRFDPRNPFANKLQWFAEAARTDARMFLLVDCDTLIVRDPLPLIEPGLFQAKIADLPTVAPDAFERVFSHFGLPLPPSRYATTFGAEPILRYCNSGVLAISPEVAEKFIPVWRDYNTRILSVLPLLGPGAKHANQASLALAFAACQVPFQEAPLALNFPLHLAGFPTPPIMLTTDPAILHYHDRMDADGFLHASPYPLAQKRIEAYNQRWRQELGTAPPVDPIVDQAAGDAEARGQAG